MEVLPMFLGREYPAYSMFPPLKLWLHAEYLLKTVTMSTLALSHACLNKRVTSSLVISNLVQTLNKLASYV